MRALRLLLVLCVGCLETPAPTSPRPTVSGDASTAGGDAGGGAADAGPLPSAAGGALDAGPRTTEPMDGGVFSGRLVVGLGTGQLVAWPLRASDLAVGDATVLEVGAALTAVARRPGTTQYLLAVEGAGMAMSSLRLVQLEPTGRWRMVSTASAGTRDVSFLTFDGTGTWVAFVGGGAFRTVQLNADGSFGAPRSVSSCDAQMLLERAPGFFGTCRSDNRIMRFDFSVSTGLTMPRSVMTLPSGFNPVGLVSFGAVLGVHGAKANGAAGSENRVGLFAPNASSLSSSVVLKPPNTDMSAVYATVSAMHPTLSVGYFVNGGSSAYGGNNLGVVGLNASGAPEVRQHVMLPWANAYNSGAVAVTPDGRWLLVGTTVVTEVRAWPIDPMTGQLGMSRVVVLADEPVFIEASGP